MPGVPALTANIISTVITIVHHLHYNLTITIIIL